MLKDSHVQDFFATPGEPYEHLIANYGRSIVEKALELAKEQLPEPELMPYIQAAMAARADDSEAH